MSVTNKLGDMLLEMRNPSTPQARVDEIVRLFNELSDREEQYKSWLQRAGSAAALDNAVITNPNFQTSPLRCFHAYATTNEIANNTWTPVTFATSGGDTSMFYFWQGDLTKFSVAKSQFNITMDGFISWEANTTGDRLLRVKVYEEDATALASQEITSLPTSNSVGFGMKQNFSYTEDIRGRFPTVAYMVFEVYQNSGGALDVETMVLSLRLA